ncbi:DNA ligase D [Microbulbifer rhizosphaerae]|uniref:DNA ligase (ATP) n=1 Tax=Microbulbifer rhizosphaerae TaxID=1562603 RepID=A0A7W4ZBG6_9GAMM|nr:DNA ligase D [Microbulbifer rhizosphaerae]MBB3063581.1 bifunctional non-homologous end joining protein LigD [Microbulbifer rhizosphaerae]
MQRLEEYRRKRDFTRTREPAGEAHSASGSGGLYVMHKHAASHDHFDLRLEQDGVLKSWALPKGPSLEPGEKRLAVEVEDHPLDYADFEGVIPKKAYGGGTVMLWDRGTWRVKGRPKKDRIDIELDGERLKGSWVLTRMTGKNQDRQGRNWLMIKRHDDKPRMDASLSVDEDSSIASGRSMAQIAEDRDTTWTSGHAETSASPGPPDPSELDGARRAKLPRGIKPQLATAAREVPSRGDWIYEIKLDGYRLLARVERGEVRLITRNGQDWSDRFPELAEALETLPVYSALLDGEVVAMDREGITRFGQLQEALSSGRTAHLIYQVFDLPYLEGYDLAGVALLERKRALEALLGAAGMKGGTIRYSDHLETKGAAFFERACQMGLEGIVCKRADSHYQQQRSRDWVKVKCVSQREEFVVGGYTDPGGARSGFGALLMGAYGDEGLVYAGRVGTGFSQRLLERLGETLQALEIDRSPFHGAVPDSRSVHWVRPELVIEAEFTERTRDGRPRHPVFHGLREDRDPREIRMTNARELAAGNGEVEDRKPRRKAGIGPRKGETSLLGVRLTHPDRVLFPDQGLTKLDLARFYEQIQDWVLPHLARRPLALLRCPEGRDGECFFQKHPRAAIPQRVPRVDVPGKEGSKEYLYVESAADLVGLVQAGALEIHPWGSRIDHLEQPDILVFDLDPHEGIAWREVLRVARTLRERIESLGLTPFLRTTGGKGLHLVVPLEPDADWDRAKAFARAVAEQHAREDPKRLTANMSKARREGRIFIDYLRNGRGSTAVASYTVRARKNAPVAVPIRWDELNPALRADRYNVGNLPRRLAALRRDPWAGFREAARPLDAGLLESVGVQ